MKVNIPKRDDAPETNLHVKIIKKDSKSCDGEWPREVLILIPGGPGGNHTKYADMEESFLEYGDLVLVDLRGCGYSDQSDVEFCTMTHHADDIEALRQALNIDKPIIHGCSYGAMVAAAYAIRHPEQLSKLILSCGAVSGSFIESAKRNLSERGTKAQIEVAKKVWEGRFQAGDEFSEYRTIMAPLYSCKYSPKDVTPAAKPNIPFNIALLNFAFQTFLKTFDHGPELHKIKVPSFIVTGKQDWITDVEQARALHEGIENSTLLLIDECSHFLWEDQKDLYFKGIGEFLGDR